MLQSPVVDTHVHLWPDDRIAHPPASVPDHPFPPFDGSVEALIGHMDANGVDWAVIVQTPWYKTDDRYIGKSVARYPERLIAIDCADLQLEDTNISEAARYLGQHGYQGLRLHLTGPSVFALMEERALAPLFSRSEETSLPVQLIYQQRAMHRMIGNLARDFPDAKIILDHFAYTTANQGASRADEDELLRLSETSSIFVKLAVHNCLSHDPFPWRDLHDLQERLIESFGADRLMWGSNFPMHMPSPTYWERLAALREHFPFRTEADRDFVLGGTAVRLWPQLAATTQSSRQTESSG